MICEIILSDGRKTQVSQEDWLWAAGYKWSVISSGYVSARVNGKTECLHILIAARMNLDWLNQIDHWDRNRLNNQRNNLRPATSSQNQANSRKQIDNTSGFKGVTWDKSKRRWLAQISVQGRRKHLGRFLSKQEATEAYTEAEKFYFGAFASSGDSL